MTRRKGSGLFITGTDTGIGKTYVAAAIARQLAATGCQVGVYKPAASGCQLVDGKLVSDDAVALWQAAGRPGELAAVCPQQFYAPLAPHLAAEAEGKQLDAELLRSGLEYWTERSELVLVEGAGGLMSPLGLDEYVADLALDFGFPLIVVAPNRLGVINQVLQTLITATTFREGLSVAGVVLNHVTQRSTEDVSLATNAGELIQRMVPPLLAELEFSADCFDRPVDWRALAAQTD
jgi:dethiobiotin synthetase